jgi:hypothetical protein
MRGFWSSSGSWARLVQASAIWSRSYPLFTPTVANSCSVVRILSSPTTTPQAESLSDNQLLISVFIDEAACSLIEAHPRSEPLFLLNALPVIQAQVLRQSVQAVPFEAGEWVKVSFAGVQNCFFASAYGESSHRRAWFEIESENIAPEFFAGHIVNVFAEPNSEEVSIYYDCKGREIGAEISSPARLSGGRGAQFSVPYPPVGGNTFSSATTESGGLHYYLYHSLFRPAMLTHGDIIEILRHQPYNDWFELPRTSLCNGGCLEPADRNPAFGGSIFGRPSSAECPSSSNTVQASGRVGYASRRF